MMGSPEDEAGRFDNENLHMVTLTRDYYLGKFPVTQAQWKTVRSSYCPYPFCKDRNRPIVYVSWDAAKEFCDKLNEKYAGELPAGYRFDLPTEAQWEYACRAGTTCPHNSCIRCASCPLRHQTALSNVCSFQIVWHNGK